MNRNARAAKGQQALEIIRNGWYTSVNGRRVDVADEIRESVEQTILITPGEWRNIEKTARDGVRRPNPAAVEITGETTLAAAERLVVREGTPRVLVLNFASAKNPGGGFLSGARAQEESLARSSALYATLIAAPEYYDANRASGTPLYTDHAILSPAVPVWSDDEVLLDEPYSVAFLTSPAANRGALRPGSGDEERVNDVMARRINGVFAGAAAWGYTTLVLGAWGCGAFRNDAGEIARLFAEALSGPRSWRNAFERIVFAVFDPDGVSPNRAAFERALGESSLSKALPGVPGS